MPDASVAGDMRVTEQSNREAEIARDGPDLLHVLRIIQAETQYDEALARVFGGVAREQRQFLSAGSAPRCPERHDDDLAAQCARVDVTTIQGVQRDRWRWCANDQAFRMDRRYGGHREQHGHADMVDVSATRHHQKPMLRPTVAVQRGNN